MFGKYLNEFKDTFLFFHFFCSSKRNETKKRRPEMTTSACLSARYTSLKGTTKQAEVRTPEQVRDRLFPVSPRTIINKVLLLT